MTVVFTKEEEEEASTEERKAKKEEVVEEVSRADSSREKEYGGARIVGPGHYCQNPGHYEATCRQKQRDMQSGSATQVQQSAARSTDSSASSAAPSSSNYLYYLSKTSFQADCNYQASFHVPHWRRS